MALLCLGAQHVCSLHVLQPCTNQCGIRSYVASGHLLQMIDCPTAAYHKQAKAALATQCTLMSCNEALFQKSQQSRRTDKNCIDALSACLHMSPILGVVIYM